MPKFIRTGYLLALGAAALTVSPAAFAYTGQELAPRAKVTLQDARNIALKAAPGQITDEELEEEAGGSGLRYTFDVVARGVTREVGIDAQTGAVIENAIEGANPD